MLPRFEPAPGLSTGDAQTIFAHLRRPKHAPARLRRERWDTPDTDFVDVDRLDGDPGRPHLLVLHGLEGSSRASYVMSLLRGASARGWGATALNFRSCSGVANRLARSYHAGDTTDALFVVERIRQRCSGPIVAAAFSLGANVLLRLAADTGERCPFHALVAVSAPYDLSRCADNLDHALDLRAVYRLRFVQQMKGKALDKAARHPEKLSAARIRGIRTLREFDDVVTAPLAGFDGVADYYRRASAGPAAIAALRKPTLLISAADDPIVPGEILASIAAVANPLVTTRFSAHGGHVGFVAGSVLAPRFYAEDTALAYLEASVTMRAP
jgi:predicted alpha/beta-fold hydrolase